MLHVALANVRMYARRYIAVVLAVAIGTAFLAATLAVNSSTQATLKNSLGDTYKTADLVAFVDWSKPGASDEEESAAPTMQTVNDLRQLPEVSSAYAIAYAMGELHTASDGYNVVIQPVPAEHKLGGVELVEGTAPLGEDQLILDEKYAEQMGVSVGDTVAFGNQGEESRDMKVVGLQKSTNNPQLSAYAIAGMDEKTWMSYAGKQSTIDSVVINTSQPIATAQSALEQYFADQSMNNMSVLTADQKVLKDVSAMTDGTDQLTVVLVLFALIALVVTALVVVNTFNVVIAQRTRELALLRTLGAKRGQIRSSVLIEALLIGIVASVLGVVLAVGLLAGLIQILHLTVPSMSFATLSVTGVGLVVPVVVGILLTVLAASLPARRAMKLAPLAALRPFDAASAKSRAGKMRIVFGSLLVLIGAVLLAFGALAGLLAVAFLGGLLSFPGVLMLASLFVPGSVYGVGRAVAGSSVPRKLAALNAVRNPGRTTATATALLIGVTLVAMIMVGGQTAKSSMNNAISGQYPVDLTLSLYENGSDPQHAQQMAQKVSQLDGVQQTTVFESATASDDEGNVYQLMGVDPEQFAAVSLDPSLVPAEGEVVLVGTDKSTPDKPITLGGQQLTARHADANLFSQLISLSTLSTLHTDDELNNYSGVLIKTDPNLPNSQITQLASDIASAAGVESYMVDGGAVQNAMFTQIIDVLLAIVSALLAVAVLIALIGVANTLSLSVLERTRENSLLRALGLKKRQLRSMLAQEAILIGGVAALLGLILGVAYGILGAKAALSTMGEMSYSIPWWQLVAVLAVSLVAALLASVTPSRRAAKLSPVQGLATE